MNKFVSIAFLFILFVGMVGCDSKKMSNNHSADTGEENVMTNDRANHLDINESNMQKALPKTTISVDKEKHDFGTISEGEIVTTTFTLTNTGDNPLIIDNAKGSCGCTVPNVEKGKPIAPGKSTDIEVRFNSNGRTDLQRKQVTISGNFDPSPKVLNIQAQVTPKSS